jgi:hypothetical protein
MISRMILVGLVAVLGVSLPSRSESGGWLTSVHAWAIAQLAEWDTYTSGEDLGFIVTETPDSSPREATQAATCSNTTASVAFEPIPVDDNRDTGLAYELNRMAEGLDNPATTTAIVESPTDFVAVSSSDSIELKLVVELCRIAENSARHETVSSPPIPQPRTADAAPVIDEIFADGSNVFAPAEPEPASITQQPREANTATTIDELFADGSEVFAPAEPELASITQPKPASIAARPEFEPIPPLVDLAMDIAAKWNRFVEGIKIRPEDAAPRPVRTPTFEPIKVPADLESGIAYELNHASEGLDNVPPAVRRLGDTRPQIPGSEPTAHTEGHHNHGDASIGKALSLTRDAAFAWMNVLAGMTPVAMTSQ